MDCFTCSTAERNVFDSKINGKLGFGAMRPPVIDGKPDIAKVTEMVDSFMAAGFNYFDTAHVYLDGQSEDMLKQCLTSRYPRDSYFLVDKLTGVTFKSEAGIRPVINQELKACGVSYFDCLLMHSQGAVIYNKFKRCRAYEQAFEMKKEGLVRHVGISFHDRPEVLEQILTDYPEIEVVQLQFNYFDFYNPVVRSKECYDVCCKFNKPVVVMEPVKGGILSRLSESAQAVADSTGCSASELAIRFAAGFDNVMMVLSGMSTLEQVEENVGFMRDFRPLSPSELSAVDNIRAIIQSSDTVQCTDCRYCVSGCPSGILIPSLIAGLNELKSLGPDNTFHSRFYYNNVNTADGHGLASSCIKCGKCESVCPQHLPIRSILEQVASVFETKES